MKNIALTTLLLFPILINAQFESGWKIYDKDSIWVVKHEAENKIIHNTGEYTNGQIKYRIRSVFSQILDTVSFYDKNGDVLSRVLYKPLEHNLRNDTYNRNYGLIDSIRVVAKDKLEHCFPTGTIHKYIFFDASNSYQQTSKTSIWSNQSYLYEPLDSRIESCMIKYSIYRNTSVERIKNLIYFEVDSNFQIVRSNIDLKRVYNLKYDLEYAESIKEKYGFRDVISSVKMKGLKVIGPYLEIRHKDIYWVIQRQSGELLSANSLEFKSTSDHIEEVSINAETGKVEKTLLMVGSDE